MLLSAMDWLRACIDVTHIVQELKEISGVMFDGTDRQLKTVAGLLRQHHRKLTEVCSQLTVQL